LTYQKSLKIHLYFQFIFYSIKDIAKYLDFEWQHQKAGGAQSIFWYEQWLETKDKKIRVFPVTARRNY